MGLDSNLIDTINSLKTSDRIRITGYSGSYVGHLFNSGLFTVYFRAWLDRPCQTYIVYYDQIKNIEKLEEQ